MTRWMMLALLVGCGDVAVGETSAALWDGGSCDLPAATLYELRFLPVDTDCGPVRERVRRLEGPSDTGFCLMEPSGAEGCRIDWVETCDELDGDRVVITGGVIYDREEWRGVADVSFRDSEGVETCAGRYDVRTEVVR